MTLVSDSSSALTLMAQFCFDKEIYCTALFEKSAVRSCGPSKFPVRQVTCVDIFTGEQRCQSHPKKFKHVKPVKSMVYKNTRDKIKGFSSI